jgi:riboflavin kinase/FMN adenylyltransferase
MSATIGNFDGLHLGHQAILNNLKEEAKSIGTSTLVFFTEPHAAEYFSAKGISNTESPPRLCPWREKFRLLNDYGIDYACFLKFNSSLKSMTPENFIKDILEEMNLKSLIVGDDFRFGAERVGDFNLLKEWGNKTNVLVSNTETVIFEGKRVSSTRIREALLKSDFNLAASLLGRPYIYSGKVVYGNQLGRTINVPTANLWIPKQKLSISGVYAVTCMHKGANYKGIANMGVRPTVGGEQPVLEVHLFDFNDEIYGQRIDVEFKFKIRDEKKFESLAFLKEQIQKDISLAKKLLQ